LSNEQSFLLLFSKCTTGKKRITEAVPSSSHLINIAQFDIKESIPYLKELANNGIESAVYALAIMQVEDYEDKAVTYFDIDTYSYDYNWAEIINSQKVWYAYMSRLKSNKYVGYCPVSYRTIDELFYVLKDFPRSIIRNLMEPLYDGMLVPVEVEKIVPDDCYNTEISENIPINPDHIKIVVDWLEANKGKYELRQETDRTF
jgi:hypothetical protein